MELKDVIYIVGGLVAVIASHFRHSSKLDLHHQRIARLEKDQTKFELRLDAHEKHIDAQLKSVNEKIDKHHGEVTEKLTEILVNIERIRK